MPKRTFHQPKRDSVSSAHTVSTSRSVFKKLRFLHLRRNQKRHKKGVWLKRILAAGAVLFGVGLVGIGATFAYFAKDLPNPDQLLQRNVAQTTKIYDRLGTTVLYEIHGDENRTLIQIADLPPYIKDATVVIEDRKFYEHHGVDWRGIVRAVFKDVQSGDYSQGGSTITQQLVKNSLLTSEKSVTRKIKEFILALEIEQKFSKDEILQLYLNEIPYGSSAYGIESAANTFFGVHAKDLTVAQATLLASLPNRPSYYSPFGNHTDDLRTRQLKIIDLLQENGKISEDEAKKAKDEAIVYKNNPQNILAPHFVFFVTDQLVEKYGQTEMEQGGLKVITTIDMARQKIAEEEVAAGAARNEKYGASNAALVAIEPSTGEVMAMVGSRNYFDAAHDGNVNVTTRLRQPGSSFKPYVYATAFANGYTPETLLWDVNTDFGSNYNPRNFDNAEHGLLPMKSALARSLNIPAVKTGYLVGPENVVAQARKMGLTSLPDDPSQYGLSTSLGSHEVRLIEHVNGFATFANEGNYVPYTGILKVEDAKGNVLEEYRPKPERVLDENVARTMSNIMSDNSLRAPTFGTRNPLTLSDRPVAAKTGTTNDFKDGLTLGYTPSLAVGVWVGNNSGTPMKQSGSDGVVVAAPIWHNFMQRVMQGTPVQQFTPPQPITTGKGILDGKKDQGVIVKVDKTNGLLATPECPASQVEERTYGLNHSELYYIDRTNPKGPAPEHPEKDPQFNNWEKAVLRKASGAQPPTEPSPNCSAAKNIAISITSPANGAEVSGNITIKTNTTAGLGVGSVTFYADGALIGTDTDAPYQASFNSSTLAAGAHAIKARVTDTAGNIAESSITIKVVDAAPTPPAAPTVNAVTSPTSVATQSISGTKPAGTSVILNGTQVVAASGATTWTHVVTLSSGDNTLTFKTKDADGLESSGVTVHITYTPPGP